MAIGEVTYNPTSWVNGETPLNQANMNNIEGGVSACASGVNSLIEDVNTIPRVTNSELTIHDTIKLAKIGSEDSILNQVSITPKSNSTTDWDIEVKSSGGDSPTVNVKSDTQNVTANLSVSGRISSDSINTNSIAGSSQITMKSSESVSGTTVISAGDNKLVVGASGTPAKISNVADPTVGNDAANKDYVDGGLSSKQNVIGNSLDIGQVNLNGETARNLSLSSSGSDVSISGVANPSSDTGAANKQYVDAVPTANSYQLGTTNKTIVGAINELVIKKQTVGDSVVIGSAGNAVTIDSEDAGDTLVVRSGSGGGIRLNGIEYVDSYNSAANKKYVDDGLATKQDTITDSIVFNNGEVYLSSGVESLILRSGEYTPINVTGVATPSGQDGYGSANVAYVNSRISSANTYANSVPENVQYTFSSGSKTIVGAINDIYASKQTSGQPVSIFNNSGGAQLSADGASNTHTLTLKGINGSGDVIAGSSVYVTGVAVSQDPDPLDAANIGYVNSGLSGKQNSSDNSLETSDTTIVGAINELNSSKQPKIESSITLLDPNALFPVEIRNVGSGTVSLSTDAGAEKVVLSGVKVPQNPGTYTCANVGYVDDKFSASETYAGNVPTTNTYTFSSGDKTVVGAINDVNGKFNSLVNNSYAAELKLRSVECYNTEGANSEKSIINPFSISVETYASGGFSKSELNPGEVLLTKDVEGVISEVTVSADSVGDDGDVTAIRMYCDSSSDSSVVLTGVAEPISDVDAANKYYVDSGLSGKQDKNSNDIRLYSRLDNYVKLSSTDNVVRMSYTDDMGTSDVYITGVGNPTSQNGACNKGYVDTKLDEKQNSTDNSLSTSDKTVVGAINELKNGYETAIVASVPYDHSEVAYFFGRYLILYNKDRMSSYGDMKLSRAMFGDSTRVLVRQLSSPSTVVTTLELQEDPDTGETIFPSIKDNPSLVDYTQYIIQRDFTI